MIHDDDDLHVGHQGLHLAGELADEGGIVVDTDVWNDIDGKHPVML